MVKEAEEAVCAVVEWAVVVACAEVEWVVAEECEAVEWAEVVCAVAEWVAEEIAIREILIRQERQRQQYN
jgi:hypothetical protein